ncbi:DNA methyltransferase [Marispirochaeta aestuarii]|uniref:Site-specific DNA-methyltransferase (adenine-specific) n=1 Tax=Marispirochaeta aestuarii TaxID=1963862 RepID=A0A1Y1S2P0_9SPIO|nr:DNA methyltransferase [Marispirochaeta aestuarii]
MVSSQKKQLQPFLKWAGGKRWLIQSHPEFFRYRFSGKYIEPFLGGGAAFAAVEPKRALLSDTNEELINLYFQIRQHPHELQKRLEVLHSQHSRLFYYQYRGQSPGAKMDKAVRMLYLNRTCFNGIYRVNRQGRFNVPMGTKTAVVLPSDDFVLWAELLANAELKVCDFEEPIHKAGKGDFIFADPPYTVSHNNNGFLKYNEVLFSWEDQVRLSIALISAAKRGAVVVATNANHPQVVDLYSSFFSIETVTRPSTIAAKSNHRGRYEEVIIHNLALEDKL